MSEASPKVEIPRPVLRQESNVGFNHVLRITSVVGGANLVGYVISLVRIKFVAVLLGASGVGIVTLLQSNSELVPVPYAKLLLRLLRMIGNNSLEQSLL